MRIVEHDDRGQQRGREQRDDRRCERLPDETGDGSAWPIAPRRPSTANSAAAVSSDQVAATRNPPNTSVG